MTAYKIGQEMIKYNFNSDVEPEPISKEDLENKNLNLKEIEALQV